MGEREGGRADGCGAFFNLKTAVRTTDFTDEHGYQDMGKREALTLRVNGCRGHLAQNCLYLCYLRNPWLNRTAESRFIEVECRGLYEAGIAA